MGCLRLKSPFLTLMLLHFACNSTTYIVVVNTPYADEDKLVLICEEYMVTLAWKFVDKIPSTFTLVEDYFPAAYATDIKLQERYLLSKFKILITS